MKTVIKIMYSFDIRIKNSVILSFIQDLRIYKIKKAAMFGLDARIALAIFGALSVITGAVLYSALDNADAIRDLNQINEIAKAYESFIIDTGKDLPIIATHYRHTKYLLEKPDNSYKNWRGPYISGTVETLNSTDFLKIDGKIVPIISATDEVEWGGSEEWWLKGYCTEPGRKKCFAWICYGVENLKRANQLDKKIDIEDSLTNGDFRCQTISGNTACFYKVMSIKFLQ